MSLFRTTTPFLQNNGWQNQALNALRYNTSQVGSVLPLIYGTVRQQVNLIALGDYRGPGGGKKGKGVGPLPLGGTNTVSGKGGGGAKGGKGKGKKSQDYSVDVAFGICQGPVTFNDGNQVFANSSVEAFSAAQLQFYVGNDGQAGDPTFDGIGSGVNYSGTCWITGTPMDLGMSPAIPNISFEINGIAFNTGGPQFPVDANPGYVINDFLTNLRYGASFPAANLDNLLPGSGTSFGDYCQAAGLLISVSLDGQQRAAQWLDGLAKLLNTAIVCSGELLKFIPYGDLALNNNGATWTPNLVPVYSLTDADFLPWHPHQDGADPEVGQDDPIIVKRTNPADAFNWFSIEYLDRSNFYNSTVLAVYAQAEIDQYGLRIGDSLPGKCFASATAAQTSAQLALQRSLYIRNSPYKFQVGWDKALLEPMDIVLITGRAADSYLVDQPVRVLSIEENDNGDLTVEAEQVQVGAAAPPGGVAGYYWELTINALYGQYFNGEIGELQAGFANTSFNLYSPTDPGGVDTSFTFKGDALGGLNSVAWTRQALFGTWYLAFANSIFGGFGIEYAPGRTYGFAVDTNAGAVYYRDVTGGGSGFWNGCPSGAGGSAFNRYDGSGAPAPNISGGYGYDLTPFGSALIFPTVTSMYAYCPGAIDLPFRSGDSGPNSVTFNTGATPFVGTIPAAVNGQPYVPWAASGATLVAVDSNISISGMTATWDNALVPNVFSGVRVSVGKTVTLSG